MESDSYIKPFFVIEWIQNVLSTWKYIWSPPVSRNFLNPCWRYYFTSQSGLHYCHVTLCYMLLRVVGSCCAKSETGQTFEPTTPEISFVLCSPKRSVTVLDPFAQLFQHWWDYALALYMVSKSYGLCPSHDALQVPTLLRVNVASVCA